MSGEKQQIKMIDEIDIKQEIVFEPDEWVPAQFCSDLRDRGRAGNFY